MAGRRGTRKEGPFESPTPQAGHMPAPSPRDLGGFGPKGKRGEHDSDFSGNETAKPRELRPTEGDSGTSTFSARKGSIVFGEHDPRRSHS